MRNLNHGILAALLMGAGGFMRVEPPTGLLDELGFDEKPAPVQPPRRKQSGYFPHQGKKECARRLRRMQEAGQS